MQTNTRPLVDILAEQTGQSVGMRELDYVYIATGLVVDKTDVDNASAIQTAEASSLAAAEEKRNAKLTGKEYLDTGVTVPFTSEDAIGLLQVQAAFGLGLTTTVIRFSNGQSLPMTVADFPEFATWFTTERNNFFV